MNSSCDICHYAKQQKLPFSDSMSRSKNCFDIVHVDIWGPFSIPSISGHRYFLTIVDDKSIHTWIYLMKYKSQASHLIKSFVALVETQHNKTLKCIRSDNGLEFKMTYFYNSKGIIHQTTCVETPQQNGVVERKHQHIMGVTRALMFQAILPNCFWNFVVSHSVYLINRQPSKFLSNLSPTQVLYNEIPHLSNLKVFGCLCFISTVTAHWKKLDSRARKCIFLGYKPGTKGYTVYDLKTREIFVSIHAYFYEHIFPYCKDVNNNQNTSSGVICPNPSLPEDDLPNTNPFIDHHNTDSLILTEPTNISLSAEPNTTTHTIDNNPQPSDNIDVTEPTNNIAVPLRKSTRISKPPFYLRDFF